MLLDLFAAFVFAGACAAFADTRLGLRLAIVVGVLQDPVRKLTPGAPPILAIAALPVVAMALLGLFTRDPRALARLARAHPRLVDSLRMFALALLPGLGILLVSYGASAWRAALLGVFGYLAPLAALVWGFNFVRESGDLRRLLAFYCIVTALLAAGSLVELLQLTPEWPAVGTAALGASWLRFAGDGQVIRLISGFYRSPDIMGWHAATLLMGAATLGLTRRPGARVWWLPAVWAAFGVLVCGRRKMLMMPVLWLAVLLAHYLRSRRPGGAAALAVMAAVLVAAVLFAGGEGPISAEYYLYAASIATDAPQRLHEGTFGAVWMTLVQSGVLGAGIGSASQGMQHLGGDVAQGWQESGASKLAAELGLPGLLCGVLVAVRLVQAGLRTLRLSARGSPSYPLVVGLVGMAAANAASFLVSHQVYGDLLVMTLSAFLVGVLLSSPRWCVAPQPEAQRPFGSRAVPPAEAT